MTPPTPPNVETRGAAVNVRLAGPEDADAAARVLAASFADYAWTTHTVAADRREDRLFHLYRTMLAEVVIPYGHLWVADAGRDGEVRLVGAAGWLSPDSDPPAATMGEVAERVRELRGDRADQAAAAEALIEAHAPDYPHWYLGAVGVEPTAQGRGVGAVLLAPALTLADQQGMPARLETSSRRNVAFYERLAFRTIAELSIPEGPPCWLMERAPGVAR